MITQLLHMLGMFLTVVFGVFAVQVMRVAPTGMRLWLQLCITLLAILLACAAATFLWKV